MATVHSGRRELEQGGAIPAASALDGVGNIDADEINSLGSSPTSTNFRVSLRRLGKDSEIALGVIHVAPDPKQSRILQIF